MLDAHTALLPQIVPEESQRFRRGGHASLSHQLIEFVPCRGHSVAEKEKSADLAVEIFGLRKLSLKFFYLAANLGLEREFSVHLSPFPLPKISAGFRERVDFRDLLYNVIRNTINLNNDNFDITLIMSKCSFGNELFETLHRL
jgi:hypothetical protein